MSGDPHPVRDGTTVTVENLSQSYGDVSVLDGVDLTVEPGEFVALVGPNGAGKTTLLRSINGVLDPDGGTVALDGTPVEELSSKAVSRQVATVPQDSHVGFSFTTEQIVEMGRTPHQSRLDWGTDSEPIERALERTETAQFRDRAVDDLSGGERQRVLLARALAQEPSVLVLDEPTASLDINHQIRVLGLVAGLVSEGNTAIAAIHDLDLAARFCDRLLLLSDGHIRARGSPESVLTDDALATAFGTTTAVTRNPATGTPTVAAFDERPSVGGRVHVVGGGVPGQRALRTLWQAGFDLSAGPLPAGDRAAELAAALECPTVTAPPFEPVDEDLRAEATAFAREADVIVVTDGPGGEALPETIDHSASIRAAFGGQSGVARQRVAALGDGGGRPPAGGAGIDRTVTSAETLLAAVRNCLDSG
ncbi:heme ABC transporter ATP-binding protein [Halobacteriaceae bacterium SHR40]|uniref:heme ABC transporter ATP-binding protein n=1 Tax=Halovenus amylolytica TaxID=2500550 RepID=UPI000FE2AFC9